MPTIRFVLDCHITPEQAADLELPHGLRNLSLDVWQWPEIKAQLAESEPRIAVRHVATEPNPVTDADVIRRTIKRQDADDAAKRDDPVRRDQSKYADEGGHLRYSADDSLVYPGATGVREPGRHIHIVVWDDDGVPNAQAYTSREAALRDFNSFGDDGHKPRLIESTIQD